MANVVFDHLIVPVEDGKEEDFVNVVNKLIDKWTVDKEKVSYKWDVME